MRIVVTGGAAFIGANLLRHLLLQVTSDEPVNLAFGSRCTILAAIAELEGLLGTELVREHRPPRPGDVRHPQAGGSRLAALLPDVAPVPFRDGLSATQEWFRGLTRYRDG